MNCTNHPAARLSWVLAVVVLLASSLAAAPPALSGTSRIKCGKPTKTGRIWVQVALRHANGTPATLLVPVHVDSTWSAESKASYVQLAVRAAADSAKVKVALRGDTLKFAAQGDWRLDLVGVAKDSTGEPDEVSLGPPIPTSDQEALCSLAGTASGTDAQGGPGFVSLRAGGMTVTQQTWPGMPSEVAEQMLIGQLNGAGIPARFATPDDFAGGWEGLVHDDRVIWFPVPDTTGFREHISDVGLSLDLAVVLDGTPDSPASAPEGPAASDLHLEVHPTLFSDGAVRVRFAVPGEADRIRLEVFDLAGKRTCALRTGGLGNAGALTWNGRDERNARIPGGVYFVRLSTPTGSAVRRVVRVP